MKNLTLTSTLKIFSLLLLCLLYSCRDDEGVLPVSKPVPYTVTTPDAVIMKEASDWYNQHYAGATAGKSAKTGQPERFIYWQAAKTVKNKDGYVLSIPVFDGDFPRKRMQMILFRAHERTYKGMVLEMIPDNPVPAYAETITKNFTGTVNILDLNFAAVKEHRTRHGQLTGSKLTLTTKDGGSRRGIVSSARTATEGGDMCSVTHCLPEVIVYGSREVNNQSVIWLIVPISYHPSWDTNNVGYASGQWNPDYNGWNVDIPETSSSDVVVAPADNPIGDVAKYLDCFTSGSGSTYTITVNVDQPKANSRVKFNAFSPGSAPGHVWYTLTQKNSDGFITVARSIGFYPKDEVYPWSQTASGVMNDDSHRAYDVSLEITVSANTFFGVVEYVGNAASRTYNLGDYNCADMCLQGLRNQGISLPDTEGDWPLDLGASTNPGDLGEDIRIMPLPANMKRDTDGGNPPPNTGGC